MPAFKVQDVHFRYPEESQFLFDGINLELGAGESCLIIGDNGTGKTTLGKLFTGLLIPDSGIIAVSDRPVKATSIRERPRLAIYQGQISHLEFFSSSVRAEIDFAMECADMHNDIQATYRDFALPENQTLKPLDLPMTDLWRLQLLLMSAVFNPTLLFIDEVLAPNAALQLAALNTVLVKRRENGQVTIVAYQRSIRAPFDHTFTLEDGRLKHV